MIGDIVIWIVTFVKQQFLCIHNYMPDRIGIITGLSFTRICSKCGKYED
jgi:hypothetical protein